jgi:Escherichia/Staphylococcus phage prohead protease
MNIERKTIDVAAAEFKATEAGDGNGTLAGYASVFGDLDTANDIVLPGAYADTLPQFLRDSWLGVEHAWDFDDQVGYWTNAAEDQYGLRVEAAFYGTDDAQSIRQIVTDRLKAGKSVKMSIGYIPLEYEIVTGADAAKYLRDPQQAAQLDPQEQVRLLKRIHLLEVSIVSKPCLESAAVTGAKSDGVAHAAMPFADEFQRALAAIESVNRRAATINELRVKEGRQLSSANRQRLASMLDAMKACMADVEDLLAATEPAKSEPKASEPDAVEQKAAEAAERDALDRLLAQIELDAIRHSL